MLNVLKNVFFNNFNKQFFHLEILTSNNFHNNIKYIETKNNFYNG